MKTQIKKGLVFLLLGYLSFILIAKKANSQESQDYLIKRDLYQSSYQDYLSARQSYLDYQTLQAKEILFQKLRVFLFSRSNFLESYLKVLISRGKDDPSQLNLDEIRGWLDWLEGNRKEIEASATIDSLVESGDKLADSYPELEKSVYLFLTKLTIAQENRVVDLIEEIKLSILARIADFSVDKGIISQWLDEVAGKIDIVHQEQAQALEDIEESRIRRQGDILSDWREAKQHFSNVDDQLKESIDFVDEILINLEK